MPVIDAQMRNKIITDIGDMLRTVDMGDPSTLSFLDLYNSSDSLLGRVTIPVDWYESTANTGEIQNKTILDIEITTGGTVSYALITAQGSGQAQLTVSTPAGGGELMLNNGAGTLVFQTNDVVRIAVGGLKLVMPSGA